MSDGRDPRALLRALFDGAVQGALPFDATWEWAAEIPIHAPVHLFVLGKAAHAQGRGVISALADRGIVPVGGVVVAVAHQAAPHPSLRVVVGDHPLPGARSAAAARAIGEALARISAGDQVIACVSGGTTSLCAAARDHSSSDVLAERFRQLLADGTDIIRMNAERRSWLQWADGRLSEACQNAGASRIDVGVVSDVIGDDLRSIGCGPFLTDDPRVHHTVIASNVVAQDAAERLARAARCDVVRVPLPLQGDARTAGRAFAEQLLTAPRGARPTIVIAGGEPTMTLEAAPPDAAGGRMQAFALAAAIVLHEARERGVPTRAVTILAGGTDGRDGPTDAAGATVDAATVRRIAQTGRNAKQELAHHRSYHVLAAAGQLMRTGPTGTNVADLVLGYVPPGAPS